MLRKGRQLLAFSFFWFVSFSLLPRQRKKMNKEEQNNILDKKIKEGKPP